MAKKEEIYKFIKVAGLISFMPIILLSGPFAGVVIGGYLKKKFATGEFVLYICVFLGFLASLAEIFRVIRYLVKMNR